MSASVISAAAWYRARARRAAAGKAPRLALTRMIVLRQAPTGSWVAAVHQRRLGIWSKPQWLCAPAAYVDAHQAVLEAWRTYRLPILWAYHDDPRMRPFRFGQREPKRGAA